MLIKPFIDYIAKAKTSDKLIVEFGAGISTKLFSSNFEKVISYDNNKEYQDRLPRYKNVEYKLLTKNLYKLIDNISIADYIFVDNDPRFILRKTLLKLSYLHSKQQCVLILDNGLWNIKAQKFLQKKYFCKDYYSLREDNLFTNTIVGEMKIPEYYRK